MTNRIFGNFNRWKLLPSSFLSSLERTHMYDSSRQGLDVFGNLKSCASVTRDFVAAVPKSCISAIQKLLWADHPWQDQFKIFTVCNLKNLFFLKDRGTPPPQTTQIRF
jgi:hypothetical protein